MKLNLRVGALISRCRVLVKLCFALEQRSIVDGLCGDVDGRFFRRFCLTSQLCQISHGLLALCISKGGNFAILPRRFSRCQGCGFHNFHFYDGGLWIIRDRGHVNRNLTADRVGLSIRPLMERVARGAGIFSTNASMGLFVVAHLAVACGQLVDNRLFCFGKPFPF